MLKVKSHVLLVISKLLIISFRKLIKGSTDSDLSLVSNENFSEILWPSGWALGQVT